MRKILLGAYDQFALPTAGYLVRYDFIDEVIITGRNLGKVQAAAGIYEQLAAGLEKYLLMLELFAAMPGYFMTAYVTLDGHQARVATWMLQL